MQLAIHGTAYAPPEIISDIRTARKAIAHCKAVLRGWAAAVDEHPDDQDTPPAHLADSAAAPYPTLHQPITVSGAVNIYNAPVTIHQSLPATTPRVPRQLPSPDAPLVGRTATLTEVRTQIAADQQRNARIIGFDGLGGVGKTTFAIHLAHQLKPGFPDGQIFLRLHGTGEAPLAPDQALRQAISAFEPQCQLPADLDVAAHYRSILSDKRVLILADDVPGPQHIQALNPPPGSVLLITSRERFFGRAKILWRALGPLTAPDAIELLRTDCERLSEIEAATIAGLCGYLPLALCVSAGLLTNDPGRSISHYIADLTDETTRLQQLCNAHDPTMNIEAVLAISYQALPAAEQAALAQLSAFVTDFDNDAATEVVALPDGIKHTHLLSHLRLQNLLTSIGDDRNSMHSLVRIFARRQLPPGDAVYLRYARHYAAHAQRLYAGFPANGVDIGLLHRDWPHIQAGWMWTIAQGQQTDTAQRLVVYAQATLPVFDRLCARENRLALLEPIPALAEHAKNAALQTDALLACGNAALHRGNPADPQAAPSQALAYYAEALAITPDPRNEARAYIGLGLVHARAGDLDTAILNYLRGRSLARDLDDRAIYCQAQASLGNAFVVQGRIADAAACFQQALGSAEDIEDRRITGQLLRGQAAACLAQAAADQQSCPDTQHAYRDAADTLIRHSQALAHTLGDLEGAHASRQLDAYLS